MTGRLGQLLAVVAVASLAMVVAACTSGGSATAASYHGPALPTAPARATVTLKESGSALLLPLFASWAAAYHKLFPRVTVAPAATSSDAGIAAVSSGAASIGGSETYLSAASSNPDLLDIALAVSALQVSYNVPGVTAPIRLDAAVLAGMYSGRVTRWNDPAIKALNPHVPLPALPVIPLHQAGSSAETLEFTSYLYAQDPAGWDASHVGTSVTFPAVAGARAEPGDGGMVAGCAAIRGCVAYIGLGYQAKTAAARLGQAELKNAASSFQAPTATAIGEAAFSLAGKTPASEKLSLVNSPAPAGYPIIGYEYAVVSSKQSSPATTQDLRAFLHWAVTTGNLAAYLGTAAMQALPGQVVALSSAQIAKIG